MESISTNEVVNQLARLALADKKTSKFSFAGVIVFAKCVDVYDGDTAQFVFEHKGVLQRWSCRLLGFNCAEMRSKHKDPEVRAAEKARAIVCRNILSGLILNKIVVLKMSKFDMYGRPLVNVYTNKHRGNDPCNMKSYTRDISNKMIADGWGQPYTGKGPKKWQ